MVHVYQTVYFCELIELHESSEQTKRVNDSLTPYIKVAVRDISNVFCSMTLLFITTK